MNGRLLTARELGEYLGLKPATILDQWELGKLPGFKFGRAVRFDLDEVLAAGRRPGAGGEAPATPSKRPAGTWSFREASNPDSRRRRCLARSAARSSGVPVARGAYRYYDAQGERREVAGFKTKGEAEDVLDDVLKGVRLGPSPAAT